jgi:hypothetical protein
MNISKFYNNKIHVVTSFAIILSTISASIMNCYAQEPNSVNDIQLGKWKVIKIDGSIKEKLVSPPVKGLCDDSEFVYKPIVDENKTFIKLLYRKKKPNLKDIPRVVYDTLSVFKDVKGLLIFKFSFDTDTGFFSNNILEDYGDQYLYTEFIKGFWSFDVGVWKKESLLGEDINGLGSGKNSFVVQGHFVNNHRIEGRWYFYEITNPLPGPYKCISESTGKGNWVAVKE